MTVSSENRRNDYDGNGVTDTFPFKFMILRPQDLRVVQADQFGAETVLTLDVDYTVHGVGVKDGGEIRLTAGPLPVDHHLTLLRNMQLLQPTDLRNQGKYSPEVVETSLDRIVMTLQQQQEEIDRSLKVRATSQDHPDSLIESLKESEAAAAASAAAAGQSAQSAADSAQQAADTLDQSIQEADAILAAAGLPNPIVPLTTLWAKADGSGYAAVSLVDVQRMVLRGIPFPFPGQTPPPGAIAYNGAELLRADFPELWAWAQTYATVVTEAEWQAEMWGAFSSGDGVTTFRVPDLRGEFIRGWDAGRGVDAGRLIGSWQSDAIRNITGAVGSGSSESSFNNLSGAFYGSGSASGSFGASAPGYSTANFDASRVVPTAAENRVRNIAYNYCAFY